MKTSTCGLQQCYNSQLAVDQNTTLILADETTQAHNDQNQLILMIDRVKENLGEAPKEVAADADYCNENDLGTLIRRERNHWARGNTTKYKR